MPRLLLLLAVLALPACAQTPPPAQAQPQPATLEQIRTLAANPACTSDNQCQALALGATPCGGPEAYLPHSLAHSDPKALQRLVQRYREERRAVHAASGMLSNCRVLPTPAVHCALPQGVCSTAERKD